MANTLRVVSGIPPRFEGTGVFLPRRCGSCLQSVRFARGSSSVSPSSRKPRECGAGMGATALFSGRRQGLILTIRPTPVAMQLPSPDSPKSHVP